MKKLLLTVTLSLACVAAFAQGKVNFINNSLHLVYWNPDPVLGGTNHGNAYFFGDGGYNLTIELWAGTASTSLALQGTTDFSGQGGAGTWVGRTFAMPTAPAGANFFDIRIHDATDLVTGDSGIFTANASGGTAYYSLVQHISPAFSTWADGTYALDAVLPGARGALMLTIAPEPTTIALAGLGAAALMIFRRRK